MSENRKSHTDQVFSIPVARTGGDKYLIYAPLKGVAFIADPNMVNLLVDTFRLGEAASAQNAAKLQSLNFLNALDFFSFESLPGEHASGNGETVDTAVLFLTNRCNLNCSYCYAAANQHAPCDMPADLAKRSIDFVFAGILRNCENRMTLAFHGGGEPFMNMPVMKAAVTHARRLAEENNIELTIAGSSNGVWSDATCRFVRTHFSEMSLSFDGLPEIQDRQRPDRSGGPSFPRVMKSIRSLDQSGFSYGIRMTVTDASVDQMAAGVRFVCQNSGARKIQVEPVFFEGRARYNHVSDMAPDLFVEQFKAAYEIARDHGVHLFYSGARPEVLTDRFCRSAGSAFIVTPEGDVSTCFEVHNRTHTQSDALIIGSYDKNAGFYFSKDRNSICRMQRVDDVFLCRNCFCKWHCAGDCTIRRINDRPGGENTGSLPVRCYITQEITRYLLCRKIIESGGLVCTDTWKV